MNAETASRLRRKIKAAGSNGEWALYDGVFTWTPREDSTQQQIDAANAIIASYDDDAFLKEEATAQANALIDGTDTSPLGLAFSALVKSHTKATGKTIADVKAEVTAEAAEK